MKTFTTVENTIKLVAVTLTKKHIPFNVERIRKCANSWYNHTDVADAGILAACVLDGKDWYPGATYDNMLAARDKWFPIVKQ